MSEVVVTFVDAPELQIAGEGVKTKEKRNVSTEAEVHAYREYSRGRPELCKKIEDRVETFFDLNTSFEECQSAARRTGGRA